MHDEAYEGERSDPEVHFKNSFGVFRGTEAVDVKIGFSPELSPYVKERSWHPSQKIIAKGDGTVELHLHVALTPELLQWVLGFGSQANVITPAALRQSIQNEAEKLARHYQPKLKAA